MWSADITFTVCTSCRIISSSHCCMRWLIPSNAASIVCTCNCTVWSFRSRAAIFSRCPFSDAISLAIPPNLAAFFTALSGCWSSMLNTAGRLPSEIWLNIFLKWKKPGFLWLHTTKIPAGFQMINFWKLYTKSAPFFKFPPKTKRALLNLWAHVADTVQKMHHSVFASMKLQKIAFTFYLWFSNKSQLISPEIIIKKHFRCRRFGGWLCLHIREKQSNFRSQIPTCLSLNYLHSNSILT